MKRVDENLLEFQDDALTYMGQPFTGISVLQYSSGKPKKELNYRDGFPERLCREWYENGQLRSQWVASKGEAPAKITEWFDNGAIKSNKISEHGVELEYKEWDLSGAIVHSRKLEKGSAMHNFLERMRNIKNKS